MSSALKEQAMSSAFVKRSVRLTLKPDVTSDQLGKALAEMAPGANVMRTGIVTFNE